MDRADAAGSAGDAPSADAQFGRRFNRTFFTITCLFAALAAVAAFRSPAVHADVGRGTLVTALLALYLGGSSLTYLRHRMLHRSLWLRCALWLAMLLAAVGLNLLNRSFISLFFVLTGL